MGREDEIVSEKVEARENPRAAGSQLNEYAGVLERRSPIFMVVV